MLLKDAQVQSDVNFEDYIKHKHKIIKHVNMKYTEFTTKMQKIYDTIDPQYL